MSPEDIIRKYYDAINRNDYKTYYACMTRQNLCCYLAANMDNNVLFNKDFSDAFEDGVQNIISAKVIEIKEIEGLGNPVGTVEYSATIDFKFKKEITVCNGKQPRFILLKKESDKSGWRIQGEGTGP